MASVFFVSSVAQAGQWKPNTELFFAGGDSRSYYGIANLYPWVQDGKSIIYSDIRYMDADVSAEEINLGGGYRSFNSSETALMGFYGALDYRIAPSKRRYSQITLGGEWLTSTWDYRLNAYLPITDKEITQKANVDFTKETKKSFQGNNLIAIETKTFNGTVYEEAMSGFDIEVGRKLSRYTPYEVRGYIGGYQFSGDIVGDTVGARFRLEARPVKAFVLNLSVENDPIFKSRGLMEMRWLFGQKFKTKRRRSLSERMTQFVVRDIDIRETSLVEASKRTLNDGKVTVDDVSPGGKYSKIIHIDKSYTGGGSDGTVEKPYTSFAACTKCSNAADAEVVYLHADDAQTVYDTQSYQLLSNQELAGDGSTMDNARNPFRGLANGNVPILGASTGDATITLSSGNKLSGVQFGTDDDGLAWQSTNTAIKINAGADTNKIEKVLISGVQGNTSKQFLKGIHIESDVNSRTDLVDVAVTNINGTGVHFESVLGAGTVLNQSLNLQSTYLTNNQTGLHVHARGTSSTSVINQTVNWDEGFASASSFPDIGGSINVGANKLNGVLLDSAGGVKLNQDMNLNKVGIARNGLAGIKFDTRNTATGQVSELSLENVMILGNEGGGLYYRNAGGASNATLKWTTITANVDNPRTSSVTASTASGFGIYMEGVQSTGAGAQVVNQTLELLDIEDPNAENSNRFFKVEKPLIDAHSKNKAQIYVNSTGSTAAATQKIVIQQNYAKGIGGGNRDLFEYTSPLGDRFDIRADECVHQIARSLSATGVDVSGVEDFGSGNYIADDVTAGGLPTCP